jgi:hypothetical protein
MNHFCPGSKVTLKVERPSTRFTISSEPREIIVADLAMGTELRYSHASAEELLSAIARALREATVSPSICLRERTAAVREKSL